RHSVEATRDAPRATVEIVVAEGEKKEAVLRLTAPLADSAGTAGGAGATVVAQPGPRSTGSSTMRTVGWAPLAGGGAGLAVGVVTGLMVRSKKNHRDSIGCGEGADG